MTAATAPKISKTEAKQIFAKELSENLAYYNGDLWEFTPGKGWVNKTGSKDAKSVEFAIRKIVKEGLIKLQAGSLDVSPRDIDDIKKELKTDIQGKEYKISELKDGFYFTNGRLYIKDGNWVFDEGDKNFTPLTIQIEYDEEYHKEIETHYQDSLYQKLVENLTPTRIPLLEEHFGFHLAGEHSGVALVIKGTTTIGKNTGTGMIGKALTGNREETQMLQIASKDLMTDKGDQFFLSGAPGKTTFEVGEGGTYFTEEKVKAYNEMIDDSREMLSVRMMNRGYVNIHKVFNMIILTNSGFKVQGDNDTMKAFKNRTSVIISPATKGVLTQAEWNKLFNDDELKVLIYRALEGYKRVKSSNKPRRAKFSEGDDNEFFNEQFEANTVEEILYAGNVENKYGKMTDNTSGIAQAWAAGQLTQLTHNDINELIEHYKATGGTLPAKYDLKTFKNEFKTLEGYKNFQITNFSRVVNGTRRMEWEWI